MHKWLVLDAEDVNSVGIENGRSAKAERRSGSACRPLGRWARTGARPLLSALGALLLEPLRAAAVRAHGRARLASDDRTPLPPALPTAASARVWRMRLRGRKGD